MTRTWTRYVIAPALTVAALAMAGGAAAPSDPVADDGTGRKPAPSRDDEHPGVWRGLDLGKVPLTTDPLALPDLFEERPPNSRSFQWRKDLEVFGTGPDEPRVYYVPGRKRFYVHTDGPLSSGMHIRGPIDGDPRDVLKPAPPARRAG